MPATGFNSITVRDEVSKKAEILRARLGFRSKGELVGFLVEKEMGKKL